MESVTLTAFLETFVFTLPQLRPNLSELIVSLIIDCYPATATTNAVFVLPVKDSLSSTVSAESLKGM